MILLGRLHAFGDKVHIALGRSDGRRRRLLEGVQYVDGLLKPHRLDCPIGVPVVGLDDLQDARAKALPGPCRRGRAAELRDAQERCPCPPGQASGSPRSPASRTRPNGAVSRPRPERVAPIEYPTSGIIAQAPRNRRKGRQGEQEGEHPGGTGPRARCSPSRSTGFTRIAADANAPALAGAPANFNQRRGLLNARIGRRLVPPATCDTVGEAVNRSTVA